MNQAEKSGAGLYGGNTTQKSNQNNLNKPKETQVQPKLLNEDSMSRLLSSGNTKKGIGITFPAKGNVMNSYVS